MEVGCLRKRKRRGEVWERGKTDISTHTYASFLTDFIPVHFICFILFDFSSFYPQPYFSPRFFVAPTFDPIIANSVLAFSNSTCASYEVDFFYYLVSFHSASLPLAC